MLDFLVGERTLEAQGLGLGNRLNTLDTVNTDLAGPNTKAEQEDGPELEKQRQNERLERMNRSLDRRLTVAEQGRQSGNPIRLAVDRRRRLVGLGILPQPRGKPHAETFETIRPRRRRAAGHG